MKTISKKYGLLFALAGIALSAYAEFRRRAIVGGFDTLYWIVAFGGAALAVFFVYRWMKEMHEDEKEEAMKAGKKIKEKEWDAILSEALGIVGIILLIVTGVVAGICDLKGLDGEAGKAAQEGAELLFRLR